jgi:hypothetical protein
MERPNGGRIGYDKCRTILKGTVSLLHCWSNVPIMERRVLLKELSSI